MNLKATGALVAAALVVAVIAWSNVFEIGVKRLQEGSLDNYHVVQGSPARFVLIEKKAAKSPWFYQVSEDDIETISVQYLDDKRVSFYKTDGRTWAFTDPEGIPPNYNRWGGITLLLSGPGTRRDLTAVQPIIDDPAQYGLDDPDTIVDVGLTANRSVQFRLGDLTTDGRHHYGQVVGFPDLFLIASSWGDVISRLANEPPIPKWYIDRTPAEIVELNLYFGNPASEDTHLVSFIQDWRTNEWTVIDYKVDEEERPIAMEVWEPLIPLVTGPENIAVVVPAVDDQDYTPWGIGDVSDAIEIRFSGETERGTRFTDGVLLILGDKSEDGSVYYAKNESNFIRQPVLGLPSDWVETFVDLAKDPPYGEASEEGSE